MSDITYERRGPVAVVTIDRPDRKNAVDHGTADALADARERFADGEGRGGAWPGTGPDEQDDGDAPGDT